MPPYCEKHKLLKKYNCFILVGIPGSGKSTLANHFKNAKVLSIDGYIEKFAKDSKLNYSDVWKDKIKVAYSLFWQDLKLVNKEANCDIIIDKTNLTKHGRAEVIKKINKNLYNIVGVDFSNIPLDVCISRVNKRKQETGKDIPLEVINNMVKLYEPLKYREGFSIILKIEENN